VIHFYKRMASKLRTTFLIAKRLGVPLRQQLCRKEGGSGGQGGRKWGSGLGIGGTFTLAIASPLLAEEEKKKRDRLRQYSTADKIFDFFSSYQLVDEKGRKTTLMSARNFYNAMTPGSSVAQEFGLDKASYKQVEESELNSEYLRRSNQLPLEGGLMNKINDHGLLTFTDYHFLLLLISTPKRYLDIIFHGFDVSADGNVEAKEFIHVLARIANVKYDPDEVEKRGRKSGLIRYLFGDNLDKVLTKDDFIKLQSDLIDDVLKLEFTRFVNDASENISEVDFCRHLLYSSQITEKKKSKMIKAVETAYSSKSSGISFDSFKTFNNLLFGGADLERAMFFLDSSRQGVTKEEFLKIANWVVDNKVDPHVVDVIYSLLDEDGDLNLSTKEFNPVLFTWRHSRGFQHGALSVTIGNMHF